MIGLEPTKQTVVRSDGEQVVITKRVKKARPTTSTSDPASKTASKARVSPAAMHDGPPVMEPGTCATAADQHAVIAKHQMLHASANAHNHAAAQTFGARPSALTSGALVDEPTAAESHLAPPRKPTLPVKEDSRDTGFSPGSRATEPRGPKTEAAARNLMKEALKALVAQDENDVFPETTRDILSEAENQAYSMVEAGVNVATEPSMHKAKHEFKEWAEGRAGAALPEWEPTQDYLTDTSLHPRRGDQLWQWDDEAYAEFEETLPALDSRWYGSGAGLQPKYLLPCSGGAASVLQASKLDVAALKRTGVDEDSKLFISELDIGEMMDSAHTLQSQALDQTVSSILMQPLIDTTASFTPGSDPVNDPLHAHIHIEYPYPQADDRPGGPRFRVVRPTAQGHAVDWRKYDRLMTIDGRNDWKRRNKYAQLQHHGILDTNENLLDPDGNCAVFQGSLGQILTKPDCNCAKIQKLIENHNYDAEEDDRDQWLEAAENEQARLQGKRQPHKTYNGSWRIWKMKKDIAAVMQWPFDVEVYPDPRTIQGVTESSGTRRSGRARADASYEDLSSKLEATTTGRTRQRRPGGVIASMTPPIAQTDSVENAPRPQQYTQKRKAEAVEDPAASGEPVAQRRKLAMKKRKGKQVDVPGRPGIHAVGPAADGSSESNAAHSQPELAGFRTNQSQADTPEQEPDRTTPESDTLEAVKAGKKRAAATEDATKEPVVAADGSIKLVRVGEEVTLQRGARKRKAQSEDDADGEDAPAAKKPKQSVLRRLAPRAAKPTLTTNKSPATAKPRIVRLKLPPKVLDRFPHRISSEHTVTGAVGDEEVQVAEQGTQVNPQTRSTKKREAANDEDENGSNMQPNKIHKVVAIDKSSDMISTMVESSSKKRKATEDAVDPEEDGLTAQKKRKVATPREARKAVAELPQQQPARVPKRPRGLPNFGTEAWPKDPSPPLPPATKAAEGAGEDMIGPAEAEGDDEARSSSTNALGGQVTTPPAASVKWGISPYSRAEKSRLKAIVEHDHALVHSWNDRLVQDGPIRNGPRVAKALIEARKEAESAEEQSKPAAQDDVQHEGM